MKTKLCVCQSVTLEHMVTCVMKRVGTVKIRPSVTIVTERVWLGVRLATMAPCVKHVSMLNIASIFIPKYAFDLYYHRYRAEVLPTTWFLAWNTIQSLLYTIDCNMILIIYDWFISSLNTQGYVYYNSLISVRFIFFYHLTLFR